MSYCLSTSQTKRFQTREVLVGNVGIGGNNPIRIQSMTSSDTKDVNATVEQIMRLADVGCDIARVTVQGMKEAYSCELIKNSLIQKGYTIPLVADIHFYPPAALCVADFVEKIRINPGNFADRRATFQVIEYDDNSYARELEKIEEKFVPLIEKCIRLKRCLRIGTNHGSLSDRIMNRYGDTPLGMVESALEYTRICRKYDFHNIVFSMKASNTHVMIHAYRLLVQEMLRLGYDYPLHLGVTEAGRGEDGRIKSSVGIGSLLLDGLGDTIRVSLTEDPWNEIDPCKRLVNLSRTYLVASHKLDFSEKHRSYFSYAKRKIHIKEGVNIKEKGSVYLAVSEEDLDNHKIFHQLGLKKQLGRWFSDLSSVDGILLESLPSSKQAQSNLERIRQAGIAIFSPIPIEGGIYLTTLREAKASYLTYDNLAITLSEYNPEEWGLLIDLPVSVVFLNFQKDRLHLWRYFFEWIQEHNISIPVVLMPSYSLSQENMLIHASAELGSLLCDGLGEGVCIKAGFNLDFLRKTSLNILQACRMRSSKTEFISCPSCGRTLFDLQSVTEKIQKRTSHLPGVKIAIMGCIVNGPGEMADADFGYVGSKKGHIDLYVGKVCVKRGVPDTDAVEELVQLLKDHGKWIEKEQHLLEATDISIS